MALGTGSWYIGCMWRYLSSVDYHFNVFPRAAVLENPIVVSKNPADFIISSQFGAQDALKHTARMSLENQEESISKLDSPMREYSTSIDLHSERVSRNFL